MDRTIAWFARNGVAANLLLVMVVFMGVTTLGDIRLEVFPEIETRIITVSVPYLGAAPQEVEEGVCVRVEEAIQDLEGIKKLSSTSSEGVGTIIAEAEEGADLRKLLDEIKSRVDAIDTFPEETEKPIVQEALLRFQVLNIALSGDADEASLKHWGETLRDDLVSLPSITQVELAAVRPDEVSIEVSEEALRRWGLTFDEVVRAVRSSSLDLPGGSVRTAAGEILLRTKGQAYRRDEFEDIVLRSSPDGRRLLLRDVGTVVDGFAETDQTARFDGNPAVLLQVFRVGEQSALEVAREAKAYLEKARVRMPEGIDLTVWQDDSKVLRDRLGLLLRNGRAGLFLVFLVLALFLRLRLALWVALGIVVSFTGALWLMPVFGVSINVMSLFAFIVVLGIVVDDAIVVGENVYRHHELGKRRLEAAIAGTQEVALPVVFSILTSMAAFSTILNAPGPTGKIIAVVPIIAILTLFFSMIESLFVLPSHLSHIDREVESQQRKRGWRWVQGLVSGGLQSFIDRIYLPVLERALEWRYLSAAVAVGLLLLTVGLVGAGVVRFEYFPEIEADNTVAVLTMPQGTPVEKTTAAVRQLEESARLLSAELEEEGHPGTLRHVLASVGEQPFSARTEQQANFSFATGSSGAHLAEVNIELLASEERNVASTEITRRWRELTGPIADAVELSFTSSLLSFGDDLDIQLASADLGDLQAAADEVKAALGSYPSVSQVTDTFRAGKEEMALEVTAEGEALGLTLADVARQVRQGFYGEEAQRIQRGRDDVRVMVRYSEDERRSLETLESMRLRTSGGAEIPFSLAARLRPGRGFSNIRRVDRQRVVNVTADVDTAVGDVNEIRGDLENRVLPQVLAAHPGVNYAFAGQQEEQAESLGSAIRGFALALILIYALLAIPFRSYTQPLIVMSAIPFGLIGAVVGHMILGIKVTVLSIFGLVALTGVVVNDSLVLVDFINRRFRAGDEVASALLAAGRTRFRPILLTSLTTFAGLTPLLLEKSLQAQFIIPMAASLGFGVLLATPIVLLLVPVLYFIQHDFVTWVRTLLRREPAKARTPDEWDSSGVGLR